MPEQLREIAMRVDAAVIGKYAAATDDFNPIHIDPDFAATTPMGGIIAHGTMSLSLIWQALAATFGRERTARAVLDIRFTRPVRIGDTVTAGGGTDTDDPQRLKVWVRNQNGDAVIEGWAEL